MPAVQGRLLFKDIARRWHALAERRLAYYNELYRSGRWQRYFATREIFAARMLDVIKAAKNWAELAGRTPSTPPELPVEHDDLRPAA